MQRTFSGLCRCAVRLFFLAGLTLGIHSASLAQNLTKKLPPLKPRTTAQAVVDEHLDAINHCDWNRLMAQFPSDVEFFLPGGQVVRGREKVGEMFATFVKPPAQGGLCGLKFSVEHVFTVGNTLNVQWVASGDALAEPYRGADAYETRNGLMAGQVTTFDASQMKLKNRK